MGPLLGPEADIWAGLPPPVAPSDVFRKWEQACRRASGRRTLGGEADP